MSRVYAEPRVEEAVKGLKVGWMYIEIPFRMVVLRYDKDSNI